jgi:hypothetical protein
LKKSILILISIFVLFCGTNIFSQESKEAYDYMEKMSKDSESISNDMWDYVKTAAHNKFALVVESKRKKMLKTIKDATDKITKLPDFKGDKMFKESLLTYLNTLYSLLNEDYAKIVNMEEISEQSYDSMEAYMLAKEKAGDKMEEASEKLNAQESEFAKKYNIKLIQNETEIGKNLKKSSEVASYNNKIYLIFFKCNKQEVYLIDSMNKTDVNAMQQNLNSLSKYTNEALTKLKSISAFENDSSLVTNCEIALNFYKKEASENFPVILDYFIKRDNFEKIKKAYDTKSDSEKTEEDTAKYNDSIDEMNNAVNNFNKTNNELNKERMKVIQAWNKATSSFMDAHIPK